MTRWQKATALVPLALLSGAWTASLAVSSATADDGEASAKLPDGSTVPSKAIEDPASVSAPGQIAPGIPTGGADKVLSSASANGIPAAALAAYQRAAQVIDSADPSCHIEWPLIGAIGRVESNHGTYGGNTLSDQGVSTPGIIGIALNGSNGTQRVADTDAGEFDRDKTFDRAVGPMQFIPSTWRVVGVDGDGDGKRNPQDIDDAALATAVYLCSGDENLGKRAGQESAVYRYNHSQDYVNLVLSIADAYASGDYSATPNGSTSSTTFTPSYGDSVFGGARSGTRGYKGARAPKAQQAQTQQPTTGTGSGSTTTGGGTTTTSGGGSNPVTGGGGTSSTTSDPGKVVQDTTKSVTGTVTNTVTPLQKATEWCQSNYSAAKLDAMGGVTKCANAYLDGGAAAVNNLLTSLTDTVGGATGGLLGN
ncbi:lytic murein transglycosylase [Nocardioides marmoribigeumensis]|uniref:Membrane-bound lytic murein transglycosylase B n=1 Tax=Nocardioides marmoribigeumensis TaxID=433649 RepID=A0ABU2BSV1_9ACTN|nr:lytic murein transglycosylase [Nocardioides marmoribigeumensis]MDR7361711.1 membrane-bound lytic murein transglycosylase B [Nocardioides marmoribigeumensis]